MVNQGVQSAKMRDTIVSEAQITSELGASTTWNPRQFMRSDSSPSAPKTRKHLIIRGTVLSSPSSTNCISFRRKTAPGKSCFMRARTCLWKFVWPSPTNSLRMAAIMCEKRI